MAATVCALAVSALALVPSAGGKPGAGGAPSASAGDGGSLRTGDGKGGFRLVDIGHFSQPVYVTGPKGAGGRIFVVEQEGRILALRGKGKPRTFLDIHKDVEAGGERGLLSVAFPPDYGKSGRFYIYLTKPGGDIAIREFKRAGRRQDRANRKSGRTVLTIEHSKYPNHNGGQLQFGPDGKLYVADRDGQIRVYTITKAGPNNYQVTSTETISRVAQITNYDDDGSLATDSWALGARQVTGILVTGTSQNPVLYVSSSDPRVAPQGEHTDSDTNSGIVSRVTQTTPGTWAGAAKVDIVRGFPRSEENHSVNGLEISADGNTLYMAIGGNTNMGAPSSSFSFQHEYALAAAIVKIDLPAVNSLPILPNGCDPTVANDCHLYDIPTLDDPTRPNSSPGVDVGDPFGGNSAGGGANQAVLVPGGPVQLHATGFRNPYDLVIATDGRMYTIDNGLTAS